MGEAQEIPITEYYTVIMRKFRGHDICLRNVYLLNAHAAFYESIDLLWCIIINTITSFTRVIKLNTPSIYYTTYLDFYIECLEQIT